MSKPRKSGNRYGGSPSTRDKLSSAFVEALEQDWAEHGPSVIAAVREQAPAKYAELIVRLIPMNDANLSSASDFSQCRTMEDLGRKLLQSVGIDNPDAITPSMIQATIEAHDGFVARLGEIAKSAGFNLEDLN